MMRKRGEAMKKEEEKKPPVWEVKDPKLPTVQSDKPEEKSAF